MMKAPDGDPGAGQGRGHRRPAGDPAYLRLADSIRQSILDGVFRPGERIPTETVLARERGLSILTVRQALGLLVDEGLLERFIGRGTYVRELNWRRASFSIEGLVQEVGRPETRVRVIRTEVRHASPEQAEAFGLKLGDSLIYIKRTINTPKNAIMIQESCLKPDIRRPIMEAELEATYVSGLFSGEGGGLIKSASLSVEPEILSEEDARLLRRPAGTAVFRLDYVFFDSRSEALAIGFFSIPKDFFKLASTIGVKQ
ncbi:MAG: GntR family transcriptional regulator [Deltaproteobacteria bacterium]|jgi:GntR family transcriptional regulator|nr:GntR family transcriptional regulator [Deltaproteobacteria bacterium]